MVSHWDVAIGWAGCAVCKFSACSVAVAGVFAVGAKYSFDLALVSQVALFTTSETHWYISVVE